MEQMQTATAPSDGPAGSETTPPAPTAPAVPWKFLFRAGEQRAVLAAALVVGLAALVILGGTAAVDDPDPHVRTLRTWGLAGLPLGVPALIVSLRPTLSGVAANRRFWRWWFAGDVACVITSATVVFDRNGLANGLPRTTIVAGALVLPLWVTGGTIMLRQKSGARTVGIDLIDTLVSAITVAAVGAYLLVGPLLGSEESDIAMPFAVCLVGAPAGIYLAVTNFVRLPPGYRTPQGIAIAVSTVVYSNVGYQAVNAVHDFSLPQVPGVALQIATGYLLVALPLFTHRGDVPGLDRLPLRHQVRKPSPLWILPVLVLPALGAAAWVDRDRPNRMAFVMVISFAVLGLQTARTVLTTRETRRLYTQLEEASVELEHRAAHDALTGLVNRRRFAEVIDEAVGRQMRSARPLALLYVDLDGFKGINDELGHKAGDDVLLEVASRLIAAVRYSDTVARLGGDEFVVLCESTGTLGEAETIAERIVESMREEINTSAGPARLGASVGVAYVEAVTPSSAEELLRHADEAMYEAKQAGRGQTRVRILTAVAPDRGA